MITFARYFATPWRRCPRGALAAMVLGLLWLVAIPRAGARGAPGDLDPSFGGVGVLTTPIATEAKADALIVQSDGELVAGGVSPPPPLAPPSSPPRVPARTARSTRAAGGTPGAPPGASPTGASFGPMPSSCSRTGNSWRRANPGSLTHSPSRDTRPTGGPTRASV